MYRAAPFFTSRILIVKTSALGDIIQAFTVLPYLKKAFPDAEIDWAVERRFASIVRAHPFVSRTIAFDSKARRFSEFFRVRRELRRFSYDILFDLQGNCKSGIVTLLSKARVKVGFARQSVREWPNLFATNRRFNVPSGLNIRFQLLSLIRQAIGDTDPLPDLIDGVRLIISLEEKRQVEALLKKMPAERKKIMVCPGSKWKNKQLPLHTMASFLEKIDRSMNASFFFIWGNGEEKRFCEELQRKFGATSLVVDRLELPVWQNLMSEMQIVIAFDSGALHLAGTTSAPSFSLFGPTMPEIFKPLGKAHFSMRGECPYGHRFEKQCPLLRTCPTGACMRDLDAEEIFNRFSQWTISDQSPHAPRPAGSPGVL